MSKIFIIGLPRTGTTSISVALLEMGLTVAHTAFTKKAFEVADAISDAPCFSDYKHLDQLFPNSKFIYLTRELDSWLPSITMLLGKMAPHLVPKFGKFHPILKRSFHHTFSVNLPLSQAELTDCYIRHQRGVLAYFKDREDFLSIDVSHSDSLQRMSEFLELPMTDSTTFPKLNVGRNVASWREYKHKSKVNSNLAGVEHRKYFDYVLDGPK
ncbi:sulfotransferase family protein [Psychrosphaera sp. B3R10]|uniref:sulfotransferase family protein n=1 Tax=unclassified Psychrosphaera TaxID=2641570 RepID=UPI001C086BAA|nr:MULTISPECIES: sulfotransferase family protein [unclassified Psychrosphaera]MBU2881896.1 sulfotransferase family protein [Psychrosphaera sp. I2R16]MBU2987887.1 sulfotransferase family protein [Psychrosphaera sp. B3R10]